MIRTESVLMNAARMLVLSALSAVMTLLSSCAARQPELPGAEPFPVLGCRIVSITKEGTVRSIRPLVDVGLDPATGTPADQVFEAPMHDGRKLGAKVQRVRTALPRERYNVALLVDGRTHLRVNHMDLDIYIETTIDGQVYALHCFPEAEISEGAVTAP